MYGGEKKGTGEPFLAGGAGALLKRGAFRLSVGAGLPQDLQHQPQHHLFTDRLDNSCQHTLSTRHYLPTQLALHRTAHTHTLSTDFFALCLINSYNTQISATLHSPSLDQYAPAYYHHIFRIRIGLGMGLVCDSLSVLMRLPSLAIFHPSC